MGKPIVSFELAESRFSAQEAAVYATPNDSAEFGEKIVELIDDPQRRERMGAFGTQRVKDTLAWSHSRLKLLDAYDAAFGKIKRKVEALDQDVA